VKGDGVGLKKVRGEVSRLCREREYGVWGDEWAVLYRGMVCMEGVLAAEPSHSLPLTYGGEAFGFCFLNCSL